MHGTTVKKKVKTGSIYAVSNSYPLTLIDQRFYVQMHIKTLLEFHFIY